jgi:hypothetical protein
MLAEKFNEIDPIELIDAVMAKALLHVGVAGHLKDAEEAGDARPEILRIVVDEAYKRASERKPEEVLREALLLIAASPPCLELLQKIHGGVRRLELQLAQLLRENSENKGE